MKRIVFVLLLFASMPSISFAKVQDFPYAKIEVALMLFDQARDLNNSGKRIAADRKQKEAENIFSDVFRYGRQYSLNNPKYPLVHKYGRTFNISGNSWYFLNFEYSYEGMGTVKPVTSMQNAELMQEYGTSQNFTATIMIGIDKGFFGSKKSYFFHTGNSGMTVYASVSNVKKITGEEAPSSNEPDSSDVVAEQKLCAAICKHHNPNFSKCPALCLEAISGK